MRGLRELAVALILLGVPGAHAADQLAVDVRNASEPTLCAEKDNVYLKLLSPEVRRFTVEAAHPAYMGTIVKDTTIILQTIRKIGWNVDCCGQFASYSTAVAEAPGEPADGFYSMAPALYRYPDDPKPAIQAFTAKYRKEFGIDVNYLGRFIMPQFRVHPELQKLARSVLESHPGARKMAKAQAGGQKKLG